MANSLATEAIRAKNVGLQLRSWEIRVSAWNQLWIVVSMLFMGLAWAEVVTWKTAALVVFGQTLMVIWLIVVNHLRWRQETKRAALEAQYNASQA